MSDPSEPSIWEFALAWYGTSGVQADCLVAQDAYGLDVTALIFALYRAKQGQGFDEGLAVELARTVSARVIEPLRSARTALKSMPRQVVEAKALALRDHVMVAELDAERLLLEALVCLEVHGDSLDCETALRAVVRATQVSEDEHLMALLKRLALAAQNM